LGEALVSGMLNEEASRFAVTYFHDKYPKDYEELLAADGKSLELVADTRDNYDRIYVRVNERYSQWKAEVGRP
jgi:hypothetical protein